MSTRLFLPDLFDLAKPSRRHWFGYILVTPAIVMTAAIIVFPLLVSGWISLQDVSIVQINQLNRPLTLDNYARLFASSEFWWAGWVTLRLVVTVTAGVFLLGIATALLVNQRFHGRSLARLLVTLPWAIPEVVAAVIFAWIFSTPFGLANWVLYRSGIITENIRWLADPVAAFAVVSVTMIWRGYPFVSIMVLAGLQSIPDDYYAAAKVDGANAIQRFVYVTVPSLMPVLGVTLVLVVLSIFRDFSVIYVLTGGGPLGATQTLAIMTYNNAFGFYQMGYAAAIGMVTLVLCALTSILIVGRRTKSMY